MGPGKARGVGPRRRASFRRKHLLGENRAVLACGLSGGEIGGGLGPGLNDIRRRRTTPCPPLSLSETPRLAGAYP